MQRQQVLHLWANGSALDSGIIGWAFHDGTDGRGNQVASGVYFVRLVAGDRRAGEKVVLLR